MYELAKELIGRTCTFTQTWLSQTGTLTAVEGNLAKLEVGKQKRPVYVNLEHVLTIEPKAEKGR